MVSPDDVKGYIQVGMDCNHITVIGDGQHFEAVIVSAAFEDKSRLQRHQIVYGALGDRMKSEIHALSMKTFTPMEWEEQAS
ncbi:MAG: BolA family transcriptional regulator [Burkholderiales bacterium]|nr:BolA family transcriptional regulator [Burkholderiales bacterium]OUT77858.1 MAG: BolA family transcriptional regulator [Betaproteobacteria bacterium TMED22]|tara:strand:- start:16250 stop:16492 length:243 start_codon:yes stop_codon:yes gene_type:complete